MIFIAHLRLPTCFWIVESEWPLVVRIASADIFEEGPGYNTLVEVSDKLIDKTMDKMKQEQHYFLKEYQLSPNNAVIT